MDKPTVLSITDSFPPQKGGSASYIFCLLNGIRARTMVLCPFFRDRWTEISLPPTNQIIKRIFYSNHLIKSKYIRKAYSFLLYLQLSVIPLFYVIKYFQDIQLIICPQVIPAGIGGYLSKKIFGKSYIVICYGEELTIGKTKMVNKFFIDVVLKNAEKVVTISLFSKNVLMSWGVHENKIEIVYPPVDTSIFPTRSNQIDIIENNLRLRDKKIILMVGRLIKRKGFDNAITVFREIVQEIPSARLIIIGIGEEETLLKNLARTNGLEEYVIFLGNMSDGEIRYMYSICDVFLLPTRTLENEDTEGFGIVFIEANFFGKPVVGGRAGGTVDAIKHNVTGLLVDGNNLGEIKESILKILREPSYAARLGQQGKKRTEEEFNLENQQKKFNKLVAGLIHGHSA